MKRLSLAASLFAVAVVAPPLSAQASSRDLDDLLDLIKQSGTEVVARTNHQERGCLEVTGFYTFDKDKKIDRLTICKDNVSMDDPEQVWEVVAHESTHIMQACVGGLAFVDEEHPTMARALSVKAPHYAKLVDGYSSEDALHETEAFWMELQHPSDVVGYFRNSCFKQEEK